MLVFQAHNKHDDTERSQNLMEGGGGGGGGGKAEVGIRLLGFKIRSYQELGKVGKILIFRYLIKRISALTFFYKFAE